jgi:hypothetical protein
MFLLHYTLLNCLLNIDAFPFPGAVKCTICQYPKNQTVCFGQLHACVKYMYEGAVGHRVSCRD